jgi:RNA polymerase sigma-70 factor (ECF subfamily)
MASDTFHDLIRRVRACDQNAAAELVRLYESAIRRAVRFRLHDARLRSQFDSMDICQSVLASFFVRAAAGQYDIDTPAQLVKLLTTMARNKLASAARKEFVRNRAVCKSAGQGEPDDLLSMEADPFDQSSARELCQEALKRLTAEERELVELRHRGFDWDSIAREKNSTPIVLRKRFSRALDRVLHEVGLE